jgi:NADPH-dependent 2,4-dienoyl-CoA reductase/sulfur reductase-like enzyme
MGQPPTIDSQARPELLVAGAFAGGLLAALVLRRLGADD